MCEYGEEKRKKSHERIISYIVVKVHNKVGHIQSMYTSMYTHTFYVSNCIYLHTYHKHVHLIRICLHTHSQIKTHTCFYLYVHISTHTHVCTHI